MSPGIELAGMYRWRTAGLVLVFLWFAIGGIAHFTATDTFVRIVPPWVPHPRVAVQLSGVLELLGAAGLILARTRRAAGIGLLLLVLAVTPANVFMLQHAHDWPNVPSWALVARLPLQLALLALIAWCTGAHPWGARTDLARLGARAP